MRGAANDGEAVIHKATVEEEDWSETERPWKDRKPAVNRACRPTIRKATVEEEDWSETEHDWKDSETAVKGACRPDGAESEAPKKVFLLQFVALESDKPAFVQFLRHAGVFLTIGWPIHFFKASIVFEDKLLPWIRPCPGGPMRR